MLGVYNYTVILTYIGMLTGLTCIGFAMGGKLPWALLCLLLAGLCDMFDGKIASTMERTAQEKRFGVQIDSLSDLICFGVLPGVIVYSTAPGKIAVAAVAGLYVLCALIRLAWFNVDEEERQDTAAGGRTGPCPAAELAFAPFGRCAAGCHGRGISDPVQTGQAPADG